ncbi:type VI secretion system Vgr family protein, partial [Amaricoccus sp.]|uniref:type VI secretion system Vgr family protein n=1 Tax=Amaricoccus sp. TaxID=1872485 RepID=UPI001B58AB5B
LKLLGEESSVEAEAGDPPRWFSGQVAAFRLAHVERRIAHYEAEIRPWLWFLGLGADSRVFQNLSTVEIVEKVFEAYPGAKFEKRLRGSYPPREYCVQYCESDLAFVSRLMEDDGIWWFFACEDGAHTLILVDDIPALEPAPGYETVPFHYREDPPQHDREHLADWAPVVSARPGGYVHTDYDFTRPALALAATATSPFEHAQAKGEIYHYPGTHLELDRGDALARVRREEAQAGHLRVRAAGNARGLAAGVAFKLEGFPREDQNAAHFVLRADYRLIDPGHRTAAEGLGETYLVALEVAPSALPFRPPRITPRPAMRGVQTATVVGPGGAEIYTDAHARVKVQFHWDRLGKRDENSSCFVRVSQTWAGGGWGFIQIPRIGQEVIVDFLEGDPDRPIITGRVYNGAETPPYGVPGNETQSGWKSNSSPGGGGYNEFMFEDKAGSELVNFQAQKDHTLLVKNDRSKLVQHDQSDRIDNNAKHSVGVDLDEDVGNNKTTKVGVDRKVDIGSNDTETVGANRSLTVKADETINVNGSSTETIGVNHTQTVIALQTISVGAARVDLVGAAETRTVVGAQVNAIGAIRQVSVKLAQSHDIGASDSWGVGAAQTINVKANRNISVGGAQGTSVKGARTAKVEGDDGIDVTGGRSVKVGKDSALDVTGGALIKVGKKLMIEATDEITLKCGSATLVMKSDGTVTIDGKDVTAKASGKFLADATGDAKVKGSTVHNN